MITTINILNTNNEHILVHLKYQVEEQLIQLLE